MCAYVQRNAILRKVIEPRLSQIEQKFNIAICYDEIDVIGFRRLSVGGLSVKPISSADTLVKIDTLSFDLSFRALLHRKLIVSNLSLSGVDLHLSEKNRVHSVSSDTVSSPRGYSQSASKFINLFFNTLPDDIYVSDFKLKVSGDSFSFNVRIPEMDVKEQDFLSEVYMDGDDFFERVMFVGKFASSERFAECRVYSLSDSSLFLPYLLEKYKTDVRYDTLDFSFAVKEDSDERVVLDGSLNFINLKIDNYRLSDTAVVFENCGADFRLNIFPKSIEIDSATKVKMNKLVFSPYLWIKPKPALEVKALINERSIKSQDLFSSLPQGLFHNLDGIETDGTLSYSFSLDLDMANVDSLHFSSSLTKSPDFKIIKFGRTDFRKIEEPFLYSAYEDSVLVKTFSVSDEYENFRSLDEISPYLQAAVLYSEDGYFYAHKGFLETALNSSMVRNIKERRFVRGGSTISMQLIKNLYLSRHKTLTRKLEEALIVWLVENNRLASKRRMYEVYLNIIEWGPGIYGANEASQFYFAKDASALTPAEAIFMSSIIPRPKKFMWYFDKQHNLKPFVEGHYALVGKRMRDHDVITEAQFDSLKPYVKVVGTAQKFLPKKSDIDIDIEKEISVE